MSGHDPTPDDALERLASVLGDADRAHAADVTALAQLDGDQITYLEHLAGRDDPATDGIEGRCV